MYEEDARRKAPIPATAVWLAILAMVIVCEIGLRIDSQCDLAHEVTVLESRIVAIEHINKKITNVVKTIVENDASLREGINETHGSIARTLHCINESMIYYHDIDPLATAEAMADGD